MTTIKSIKSLILDLPPSCIEFWPVDPRYAIIGTYHLEESTSKQEEGFEEVVDAAQVKKAQSRDGSLVLVRVDGDNLKVVDTQQTKSAILDLHFAHPESQSIIVSTSTGTIERYSIVEDMPSNEGSSKLRISHLETVQVFPKDTLVTSFVIHPSNGKCILCTLTTGQVYLVDFRSSTPLTIKEIDTHSLEAWIAAFTEDGRTTYTGGDDSALRRARLPADPYSLFDQEFDEQQDLCQWVDHRIHGAGVTAILPLAVKFMADVSDLIITGSYDDHIRLLHAPEAGRRTVLAELNLGGGVWRLKLLPDLVLQRDQQQGCVGVILASCMHAGARILHLIKDGDGWRFEVVAKFEEHKSMNYGTDYQPVPTSSGQVTFLSTSFYDKLLCLWRH